jgi:hypothetical protein
MRLTVPLRLLIAGLMFALFLAACSNEPAPPLATSLPTAVATNTIAALPTDTPAPTITATSSPDVSATPTIPVITVEPVTNQLIPPPIDLQLPEGWQLGYQSIIIPEIDRARVYPVAFYTGPVTGGTGWLVIVWGFINVTEPVPGLGESSPINLWSDGLRLWRLLIIEPTCVIGTDVQRQFRVGGLTGVGTYVSAMECPDDLPDAAGWFVGLQERGMNFLFYMYTEPREALDGPAADELQNILDGINFRVEDYLTATPAPLRLTPEATDAP